MHSKLIEYTIYMVLLPKTSGQCLVCSCVLIKPGESAQDEETATTHIQAPCMLKEPPQFFK